MTERDEDPDLDDLEPDTTERIAKLERKLAVDEIGRSHGLPTALATKVYETARSSNLEPDEAIEVLRLREPESFGRTGEPASFGSLAARGSGRAPETPDDHTERLKFAAELRRTDKRAHNAVFENHCGSFMAKAMGWDHQKIPLPGSGTRRR